MVSFVLILARFVRALGRAFKDPDFEGLFFFVIIILLTGTFFYHGVEQWSYLDSLYFSVTTLTTVGLGDLAPHTNVGKIFTILYIFVGIGVILGFINVVAQHAKDDASSNPFIRGVQKLTNGQSSSDKRSRQR